MWSLHEWCPSNSPWTVHGAINTCWLESGGVAAVVLAFVVALGCSWSALRLVEDLRARGGSLKGPIGMSGAEVGTVASTLFLCGLHLAHLAATIWLHLPTYHLLLHCVYATIWLTVAALTIRASKVHALLDWRALAVTSVLWYGWALQTYWTAYRATDGFPLQYVRATIWTLLLQTVMSLILCVLEIRRHRATAPTAPDGYEALPNGDVEAGTAGAGAAGGPKGGRAPPASAPSGSLKPEEERHSWIALFWEACAYVWPEDRWLQARALLAFGLLLCMRVLNLAVPILYKKLVDSLTQQSTNSKDDSPDQPPALIWGWLSPWVLLYLGAILIQGGAGGGMTGLVNNLRQIVWIPVAQDAYRRVSLRVFSHVLDLDLGFHLGRKTGEVTKQIDRGTNALQNILSTILFSIVPTCIDVLTSSTYLAQALEPSIAITVFFTIGSYIPITIIITEWRGALRREMNRTDQIASARVTDALLNYETVKYFTAEEHERQQYSKAISDYQSAEYRSMASMNLLNIVQSAIMFIGIAVGLLVCSAGVHSGELTVGDVVLFLSLMAQLYGPLAWFGGYYRTIQQYMIDCENLFGLLSKKSVVTDVPSSKELVLAQGDVSFDRVSFSYELGVPILKDVTFHVPGGRTIAFVGATGSGKSTITRLMFRFYDASTGVIRIDGQDIRSVTQNSLRRAVGMVPQDCVLFNDTILNNIRYGRLQPPASDEEVYEVARAACIHEPITTRFPKGYETVVGERGLRLSGGEKQRVAFARALLKNPGILVLDEATSALDTLTERRIQAALASMRAQRTTLIVAHRLSTITDADTIVVMRHGEVAEMGSHAELLALGGLYAEMWNKQATTSSASAADEAGASGTNTPAAVSRPGSTLNLVGVDPGHVTEQGPVEGPPSTASIATAASNLGSSQGGGRGRGRGRGEEGGPGDEAHRRGLRQGGGGRGGEGRLRG